MKEQKLFMVLLGCRPAGRNTEQHDIFFGIGENLKDLIPAIKKSWPEVKGNIHIDAWREVNCVDGYDIKVETADEKNKQEKKDKELFFINLGGYKENEFDEFHYKILVVAKNVESAKKNSRETAFFKHVSLPVTALHPKATAHIDDKFGIDVDDFHAMNDILPLPMKEKYRIIISAERVCSTEDVFHLGYFRLTDL